MKMHVKLMACSYVSGTRNRHMASLKRMHMSSLPNNSTRRNNQPGPRRATLRDGAADQVLNEQPYEA
jgi:hypothetical protein